MWGAATARGLTPASLRRGALACAAVLGGIGFLSEVVAARWRSPGTERAMAFFSLSYEGNLPTWYSSVLLFACALALREIAAREREARSLNRWHWAGLTAGFAFMSLDEVAQLHEHLSNLVEGSGVLHYSWIVPAGAMVAVLGGVYVPFLVRLPARRRRQLLIAGALYLGGAILMELPLGWWTERAGPDNLGYAAIDHVEEVLEMVGAGLFLAALREEMGGAGGTEAGA